MRSTRASRDERFTKRMLEVADELFEEFAELPFRTVLEAMNLARADLTGPDGEYPPPDLIAIVARQRLGAMAVHPSRYAGAG